VLQAGCATAAGDLDLDGLRASSAVFSLTMIDDDNEITRAAKAERPELGQALLGELRTVPLVSRSADIVHCCMLLERISHAELVLGRLVDALRPGGILLLRTADRQSAAGFLDRAMPRPLRALTWRSLRPGEPGPYPAVYEQLASARGIQSFASRHGLVITRREVRSGLAGRRRRPVVRGARGLVALLSRGRLTAAHDELAYVIRKPEDRFARVL
jgi:SAM-dependent methyltransferase